MNTLEKAALWTIAGLSVILLFFILAGVSSSPKPLSANLYIPSYINANVTTSTLTTYATFPGVLHEITVNSPATSSVITLYDSATTTNTSTIIGTITFPSTASQPVSLTYDAQFKNGLTIQQTGGVSSFSADYQQQ